VQGFALAVLLALAVAVGCSGPKVPNAPPDALATKVWINREAVDDYRDADTVAVSGLATALHGTDPVRPADRPLNILCVSGGGKFAAFTAGALSGWTASGTRPAFDVATGVSSGAPTAVLAFLGPKYDALLSETFVNLRRSDVFRWRPLRGMISGNGLLTAQPLEDLFEERLDENMLADLRAAHAQGRRIFIATSNALTHRLTVWDLGAIASSGRPDAALLVRRVLLASCSIPGLVPPVKFDVTVNGIRYTELHADAGNVVQVFLRTAGPVPPGSNVWVLSAGKSHPDRSTTRARTLGTVLRAVSTALYSLFRADTVKLYAFCGTTQSNFRLLALPEDFKGHASSMSFDSKESHRLYWVGYQMAAGGTWETQPPDTLPDEVPPPRAGFDFVAP
jgi:hypothetical protein